MPEFPKTSLNQVRRLPDRSRYDRDTIYQIIDEALYCHVAFVQDDRPFVIPTNHARLGDNLILHGAKASRMLQQVQNGQPVCVAITLLDGLVFARSVFHHSMNYRSVMLFGSGQILENDTEKLQALEALTEHVARGRWQEVRKPTQAELSATTVVSIPIESASAKMRSGPPGEDEADYQLPVWAGVLPFEERTSEPIDDPRLASDIPVPEYILHYTRTHER